MDSKKLFKAALLTGTLTLSFVACSPKAQDTATVGTENTNSIIGGAQVAADDIISKSTVAIVASVKTQDDKELQFICTGSLLSDNVVLSAGHCVPDAKEFKAVALYIIFNRDLNSMQRTDIRLVTQTIVHPQYGQASDSGQDNHDVSLMKFQGTKAAGYQIAKFLDDESVLVKGATVTLAGYGLNKTDGTTTESDNTLRKVDVQVYDKFGSNEVILDQTQGKGACHGDSGGPAFINVKGVEYVWGVTSRGAGQDGKDDCSLASIYTKVKSERTFIDSALATLSKPEVNLAGMDGEGI
jgi:secreted trypsin-like serine protease